MNKIKIILKVNLICAVLFSLLNINFKFDVSAFAFLICAAFDVFFIHFSWNSFIKAINIQKVPVVNKLIQYEPYVYLLAFICRRAGKAGTSFAFDLICVLLWLCVFVTSCILQTCFKPANFKKYTSLIIPEHKYSWSPSVFRKSDKKNTHISVAKWIGFEILDWIDALVQAVFLVLIIQMFVFQLYKIPSESMVPEFMVNDRVAVTKFLSGPKFPLSDVGLPCSKNYKRGDIVVFRNPHYTIDRSSEVKTVCSQLVYMLTLTLVNTNTDEHGKLKYDPLVKRITAEPGEQIMMQDGLLYSRTKENPQFVQVKNDEKWAAYNLNSEKPELKRYIQEFPVTQEIFDELEAVENKRRELSVTQAYDECRQLSQRFAKITKGSDNFTDEEIFNLYKMTDFLSINLYRDGIGFARNLLSKPERTLWFERFMTDWVKSGVYDFNTQSFNLDLYEESCFKYNLMFKLAFGKIIVRYSELVYSGRSASEIENDSQIQMYFEDLRNLHNYSCFMDRRNMPVFPANKEDGSPDFIPEGCYFMMGDNRFNSFDMRHSNDEYVRPVTSYDKFSAAYWSNMGPAYVPQKLILGVTTFRFWPLSRSGKTGSSAR